MAGVRVGVSPSADLVVGEADALINIGAGVRSVLLHWAVLAFSAVGFEISADSAGHTGRCSNFLVERALSEYASFPAVFPARTLRFSPVSALAAAAAAAVALAREFGVK